MKKISIIIASAIALYSCNEETLQIQNDTPQEYTIRLNPVGDISTHYTPLTKADAGTETIWYGINIKRDNQDYLFGLYDDISKFNVQLSTSHSYSFEISAVKGAPNDFCKLDSTYGNNPSSICYYSYVHYRKVSAPFNNPNVSKITALYSYSDPAPDIVNNLFHELRELTLNSVAYIIMFKEGRQNYKFDNLSIGKNSNEWYRFYGTKTNFTPSKDETLPFTLKHEGFGLQYNVTGICDGSVSIVIDNNLENNDKVTYFTQPAITGDFSSTQKVIEFRDMTAETEQVKVTVVWTRGNNVVDDLGSTVVNVRRNKVNKINITLGEHSNSKAMMVTTDASDYFGTETKEINI